ncbi:serine protease, partial [Mesorhizobium sp. B2-3-3]
PQLDAYAAVTSVLGEPAAAARDNHGSVSAVSPGSGSPRSAPSA